MGIDASPPGSSQCVNVIKTAALQRAYLLDRFPLVHGCVVDIRTGLLHDLKVDFDAKLARIRDVYDLGTAEARSP